MEEINEEKINVIMHKDNSLNRLDLSFMKHIEIEEYKKKLSDRTFQNLSQLLKRLEFRSSYPTFDARKRVRANPNSFSQLSLVQPHAFTLGCDVSSNDYSKWLLIFSRHVQLLFRIGNDTSF